MSLATPPASATNAELIRWAFDALNRQDIDALRQSWTPETEERFPDRTCRGEEEIAAYFEALLAALPDFHMEIVNLAEAGEDVYVQWILTGTHTGAPFQGIEATGKRLTLDGIDHFVVRDGRVASNFVISDQLQFARQIGLIPPEGSAADRAMKAAFNLKTRLLQRRSD